MMSAIMSGILVWFAMTIVIIRTPTMSLTPRLVLIPITINIILAFMLPSPVTFEIVLVFLALKLLAAGLCTTTTAT